GGAAGAAGALASSQIAKLPTGPVIVLISSAVLIASLLFAPRRGLLWTRIEDVRLVRRILSENLLKDLYVLGERRGDWEESVGAPELMGMRGQPYGQLRRVAKRLRADGLLIMQADLLRLSGAGMTAAKRIVRKHRLWELYLTRQLELAADHVHRDADAMEHTLSEEAVSLLDEKLGYPRVDPHGQPIPRLDGALGAAP
ncbi:MAG: iron dependent repressor, metal binding and dimerization domain protein, partial [Acidobacteriota bacterium]